MKKILLLLMTVSMIAGAQTNEEFLNILVKQTKAEISLPYEGPIGTWGDMINENNRNLVYIYYTHAQTNSELHKLLLDYEADKESVIRSFKMDVLAKEFYKRNINVIFRYYNEDQRNLLLRENIIKPVDWGY